MNALNNAPPRNVPAEKAAAPVDDSRLRMGIETTLLAWVRTGMALMGFGFVVARFGLFLQELAYAELIPLRHRPGFSVWLGVAIIVAGTVVTFLAGVLTWRFVRQLPPGGPELPPTLSIGLALSGLLTLGGVVMAVYLSAIGV